MNHTPFSLSSLLIALALLVALVLTVAAPIGHATAPASDPRGTFAATLVAELNAARSDHGLEPITVSPQLETAATAKAATLLEDDWFDHVTEDGRTPWDFVRAAGYSYRLAGENLAMDFDDPSAVTRAWLESPTHRANMLDPQFREVGIVALPGQFTDRPTIMVVELFGLPDDRNPVERAIDDVIMTVHAGDSD